MAFSEFVIVHCSTRNSAQVQFRTFLMCSFYNLYGSGWFFRHICSMMGPRRLAHWNFFCFGRIIFFLNFKKEKEFFSLFTFFTPFREKNAFYPQFREKNAFYPRKIPDFVWWIGKKSCFVLISFMFRSDMKNSCFVLTYRPMQFQVHSMFFFCI